MSMLDTLKSCPLFTELYDDEIEIILSKCSVHEFEPDTMISEEGKKDENLFVVLNGAARVCKSINGRVVRIAKLKSGEVFGESVLLNETTRTMSIVAEEKCDVLVLHHDDVLALFESNSKIFSILMMNFARILTTRLKFSRKVIKSVHDKLRYSDELDANILEFKKSA